MGVWDFTMVSIYISIIINDVEHFFTCLFAIYIYSLEKGLFKSFVHILLSCLLIKLKEFFIYSRYMSFVGYVLKILSSTCLFISYVFWRENFLIIMKSSSLIFKIIFTSCVIVNKPSPNPRLLISSTFFSQKFHSLGFTFRYKSTLS